MFIDRDSGSNWCLSSNHFADEAIACPGHQLTMLIKDIVIDTAFFYKWVGELVGSTIAIYLRKTQADPMYVYDFAIFVVS